MPTALFTINKKSCLNCLSLHPVVIGNRVIPWPCLGKCSVCTRSVSMPLLLGFGWIHSQQLHSAWRRAGLCLGCTELRTDHRGVVPEQGWLRAKLTHSGSFCLTSLHMEQGRMGISGCMRAQTDQIGTPRVQKSLSAFRKAFLLALFLSQQKATMAWTSACSHDHSVGQVMSLVQERGLCVQRPTVYWGELQCMLK